MRSLVKIPLSSLLLVLVACGGDGATGSGTPAPSTPGPSPTPTADQTGLYMTQPVPTTKDEALVALNGFGAQGYAWFGDIAIDSTAVAARHVRGLYVRNSTTPAVYGYQMEPAVTTAVADWLATANGHGAASRRFKTIVAYADGTGVLDPQYLFVSQRGATTTYRYAAIELPQAVDPVVLLNTLNARGQAGYAWQGALVFGTTNQAIFVQDSSRPGPYSYALPVAASTQTAFAEQIATQAEAGYRYVGPLQLDTQRALYQRDATDPYPVRGEIRPSVTRTGEADLLQAVNAAGATGLFYLGDVYLVADGQLTAQVSVFNGGTQPPSPLAGPVWP